MANERLRIVIEFDRLDVQEVKAYRSLKELVAPGVIIKNIILGKLPAAILEEIMNEQ